MELQNLEKLLDKYFEGQTSRDEERAMSAYFLQNEVPVHLQPYQAMFKHFAEDKKEGYTGNALPTEKKFNRLRPLVGIAAMIAVVLGATFFWQQQQITPAQEQEAQMAYEQTKEALQMASVLFNQGTEPLGYLTEFEQSTAKVFKNRD